ALRAPGVKSSVLALKDGQAQSFCTRKSSLMTGETMPGVLETMLNDYKQWATEAFGSDSFAVFVVEPDETVFVGRSIPKDDANLAEIKTNDEDWTTIRLDRTADASAPDLWWQRIKAQEPMLLQSANPTFWERRQLIVPIANPGSLRVPYDKLKERRIAKWRIEKLLGLTRSESVKVATAILANGNDPTVAALLAIKLINDAGDPDAALTTFEGSIGSLLQAYDITTPGTRTAVLTCVTASSRKLHSDPK
ncbi:MAG TPA: hypothetical protein VLG40_03615, partial [Candidatus Saccharimonas sp.]|nr:hypothetical protein [Candidatus Saccharimonas sp.]